MSVIKPALQYPERIAYFVGANNYCWIYFRNGDKKLLAKPISYMESQLSDFIRVHKTVLINPAYIKSLDHPLRTKMAGKVYLDSGEIFPVSRRRWLQVVAYLHSRLTEDTLRKEANCLPDALQIAQLPDSSTYSIFLVTDDDEKAIVTKQIIKDKWPAYQVYTDQQSALLPNLLLDLAEQEHPTLILLDASTKTQERLFTLRHLKEHSRLSCIPVILLVSPADRLILTGYQYQANSVIVMPTEYKLFKQIIERVCQFWLHIVALPGVGD